MVTPFGYAGTTIRAPRPERQRRCALRGQDLRPGRGEDAAAGDLADDPGLIAEIQRAVDEANLAVSRAESVRRFRILAADFTEAAGQLTPTDKIRRNAVISDYAADIDALYRRAG